MSKLAFLSTDDLTAYVFDDDLAYAPLRKLGWDVERITWRQTSRDWSEFAAVIIRTTWDYQKSLPEFLSVLARIESQTQLANPLSIARWNAHKSYLLKFAKKGIPIVPTIWEQNGVDDQKLKGFFSELQTDQIIIKPQVGASAEDTFRLKQGKLDTSGLEVFVDRAFMAQTFVQSIVDEGEFSLFYFNNVYSHAILKTPKPNDFRSQEENGAEISAVNATPALLRAAEKVLALVSPTPLYARVDLARFAGDFALMELELIEPALYLRMDHGAPQRFATAIDDWLRAGVGRQEQEAEVV